MNKTIKDYDLTGKKVLIRCDFNVPIINGEIIDETRIDASLKTIRYAIDRQAKVILMSHLGRIKEEGDKQDNSLLSISIKLSEKLDQKVLFIPQTRGLKLETAIKKMKNGEIILMENTRFEDLNNEAESRNDLELSKYWANLADIYINDAFGSIHRAHASTYGVPSLLPNGIGFLIEKELKALSYFANPERPFIIILGGAKIKDKIGIIDKLLPKADLILIGGGMSYTFLKAKGYEIGTSLLDKESLPYVKRLIKEYNDKIVLPIDLNVTVEFSNTTINRIVSIENIGPKEMGMDIGPNTIEQFKQILNTAKSVFWNGPLGVYEFSKYEIGTKKILEVIANINAHVVLGGGDIVAAANKFDYKDKVTHACTGGGATLEYLEGKKLPGIEIIEKIES